MAGKRASGAFSIDKECKRAKVFCLKYRILKLSGGCVCPVSDGQNGNALVSCKDIVFMLPL
jgi:hypothetical protein